MSQVLFRHTCAGCGKRIEVSLDIEALTIQQSVCLYCNYRQLYDNRQGQLQEIYQKALSEKLKPPVSKATTPTPEPTTTTAEAAKPPTYPTIYQELEKPLSTVHRSKDFGKPSRHYWFFSLLTLLGIVFALPLFFWLWIMSYSPSDFYGYLLKLTGETANRIFDRNGLEVAQLLRQPVGNLTRQQIPYRLEEFLLQIEDKNFWSHRGIDYLGMLRAALKNLFHLRLVQGGSTLTQQLARTLMGERQKTFARKIKEIAFARYLESKLTKDEIFTHYVNRVYLGHGAWGFSAAANFYFRKELAQCNDTELLILVSLPPAPEKYSPLKNPQLLSERLDTLYDNLSQKSKVNFTRAIFEKQKKEILTRFNRAPAESIFGERLNRLPWLSEYVRRFIEEKLGAEFTHDAALRIDTTIDSALAEHAAKVAEQQLPILQASFPPLLRKKGITLTKPQSLLEMQRRYQEVAPFMSLWGFPEFPEKKPQLQTAAVGLLNQTGDILFFVGGTKFNATNQFNRAFQMRRQTGSAIKPFLYAIAIEQGLLYPGSLVEDSPIFFEQRNNPNFKKGYWLPENLSGVYEGQISLRRALVFSKNTAAVRTGYLLGMEGLAKVFQRFFFFKEAEFKSRFRQDFSVAIGTIELSPLELALGFSAFANNGNIVRPKIIKKITNQAGKVVYSAEGQDEFATGLPENHQAISGDVAEVMASMLAEAAKAAKISGTIIGKTGTTDESRDAWFVGATPDITAVVWVGYDDARYVMAGGIGASVAAPLWKHIMQKALPNKKTFFFSPPAERITICSLSGELASSQCKITRQELATAQSKPTQVCQRHSKEKVATLTMPQEKDFW